MTAGEGPRADDAAPLDPDEVFHILKNPRRRHVVEHLMTRPGPATLRELSEHVAARQYDVSSGELSAGDRRSVYVGLYQCHLPRMDDAGVVAFDRDRNVVSPGPALSQFEPYLGSVPPGDDRSWVCVYPRIVAGGWLLVLLSPLGAAAYGLTVARAALLMTAAAGLCALGQWVGERRSTGQERVERGRFLSGRRT